MSENSRSLFFLLCFIVLVLAPERMRGCVNVIAVLLFFCSANSVFYFVYCMQKKKKQKSTRVVSVTARWNSRDCMFVKIYVPGVLDGIDDVSI